MDIKTTLTALRTFFIKNRRKGHTRTMIRGVQNSDAVTVITSVDSLVEGMNNACNNAKAYVRTIESFANNPSTSYDHPLVLDNGAVFSIVDSALTKIKELETELINRDAGAVLKLVGESCESRSLRTLQEAKASVESMLGLTRSKDAYHLGMYNALESVIATIEKRDPKLKSL